MVNKRGGTPKQKPPRKDTPRKGRPRKQPPAEDATTPTAPTSLQHIVPNRHHEKNINIAALVFQSNVLMSDLFLQHDEDEVELLCTQAQSLGDLALSGPPTGKAGKGARTIVTHQNLRAEVIKLYGDNHVRPTSDGYISYSNNFYTRYMEYKDRDLNAIREEYSSSQSSQEDHRIDDEYAQKEEIPTLDSIEENSSHSNGDADSENLLGDDTDSFNSKDLEDVTESLFTDVATHLQTSISRFNERHRTKQSPLQILTQPSGNESDGDGHETSPTDNTTTAQQRRQSRPTIATVPDPYRQAVLTTPSPTKKATSKDRSTASTRDIFAEIDQLRLQLEEEKQTRRNEHDALTAALAEKEKEILSLRQEIKDLYSHDKTITDIQLDNTTAVFKEIRKKAAGLLKHLEKQMEQYEEAGDNYIAKFGANAKKEMDDIREKQQQSTEAYRQLRNDIETMKMTMQRNFDTTLRSSVEQQLRLFENKITTTRNNEVNVAMDTISKETKRKTTSIHKTGKTILDKCNVLLQQVENAAQQYVDAAAAEYAAEGELVKKDFLKQLQELYQSEEIKYKSTLKQIAQQEEGRIAAATKAAVDAALQQDSLTTKIDTQLSIHMQTAETRIASITTEVDEIKETAKQELEALSTIKKTELEDLTKAKRTVLETFATSKKQQIATSTEVALKTIQDRSDAMTKDFDGVAALETSMAQNQLRQQAGRASAEAATAHLLPGMAHLATSKATPTLVDTEFDFRHEQQQHRGTGGAPDGGDDGDDDPADDGNDPAYPPPDVPMRSRWHRVQHSLYREKVVEFMKQAKKTLSYIQGPRQVNSKNIENLYRKFQKCLNTYQIPIIQLDDLEPNGSCIHPRDIEILNSLDPKFFPDIADTIYDALTDMIEETDKQAREIIDWFYLSRDGYKTLFELMQRYVVRLQPYQNMWSSVWLPGMTVYDFASVIVTRQRALKDQNARNYNEDDMKLEFILRAQSLPQFKHMAHTLLFLLERFGRHIIRDYSFAQLIRYFDMIDKFHKTPDEPSTITDTINKADSDLLRLEVHKLTRRGPRTDAQCELCKQYGHSIATDHICFIAGKFMHLLKYSGLLEAPFLDQRGKNLQILEANAKKFMDYNIPKNIKQFIADNEEHEFLDIDDINRLFAHKVHYECTPMDFP